MLNHSNNHHHDHCNNCKKRNNKHDNDDNMCNGCVCDQLRKLQTQTEVDVYLSGGQILEDVRFVTLNEKNCCAYFIATEEEAGSTLIVDCRQIQAIRIELD